MKVNRVDGFGKDGVVTTNCTKRSSAGFTLIELVIVIALILIATGVAVLSLRTGLASSRANSGVQATLSQLRLAREEAIGRRMEYRVTFLPPATIQTERILQGQAPVVERSITLPPEIQFLTAPGNPSPGPDGFGTGKAAIDFDQANGGGGTIIFFLPDGTALDAVGDPNDGVVYISHARGLAPSHAISLWGATGRFKVWQLTTTGAPKWN